LPGKDIHAEVEDKDMYTAIDLLANKIERQIVKYKEIHMVNMHSTKVSD
jgi:putative sigma-54 modulation protein